MEKREQRLKVLFIINNLFGGGAEKVLMHILHHLDRTRFDTHLLLVCKEGVYVRQIPSDITLHWVFPDKNKIPSAPLRFLYRAVRSLTLELCAKTPFLWKIVSGINDRYDLGVSFLGGYGTPLLTYKRKNFGKTIAWFHNDVSGYEPNIDEAQLIRYKGFDKLYFVSESSRCGFLSRFPMFQAKLPDMEVVYNPIDVPFIRKAAGANNQKNEVITLVAIGRLSPGKRFDKLIRVHRRLLDKGLLHRVCILGEGELRKELEEQIRKLQVENTCSLEGFQVPYPYLASADIFVMTSDYEGLPVVICEAMSLAVPLVVPNVSGSHELLENGKYGLIVENNEQTIEEGLEKMIRDSELRALFSGRMKENRDNFIFSRAMKELEEKLLAL